ncbi:mitochondrial ubiquitin ligase activator of nfkb 1-A [Pyrus ussuriensis x Pyrus communis]|uniref:Mitochondrial ubiquitin ligase activator of nfkb 1-A n=1 Tax=Pyrus ussuriensis x Pyrus communis TaxID=2448454 RepID=A0A5N5IRN5_9ROSA|nr:mitochondrial ubiquitin ligase activator of nfkb 1-A [Pyrus ussuriensis x Pyrus communis]
MLPWGGLSCCLSGAALYLLGRSSGRDAEILKSATRINQLKELAKLLDSECRLPLVVAVSGRVSSETPINCEFTVLRGVVVEETNNIFLKHNGAGSWIQDYALMLSMSKEVLWMMDLVVCLWWEHELPQDLCCRLQVRLSTTNVQCSLTVRECVIPVCYFAKEASCSVLKEDGELKFSALFKEKQEITIEKAMCNKRKCITIVKGLHLFGELSVVLYPFFRRPWFFLFFGAFVCSLQSCLCSRPMIAVSSKSRGKESTDSSSQLNNLQLNSEIVGTSKVDCDLGDQKKEGERSDFVEDFFFIENTDVSLLSVTE